MTVGESDLLVVDRLSDLDLALQANAQFVAWLLFRLLVGWAVGCPQCQVTVPQSRFQCWEFYWLKAFC